MAVDIYAFYNNKGGVGKTTLCQNVACLYAEENPKKQVLVIDLCPQANISQFLLGGGHIGYETNQAIQTHAFRKNIVGFMGLAWKRQFRIHQHKRFLQKESVTTQQERYRKPVSNCW